jgi:hypothetical protein
MRNLMIAYDLNLLGTQNYEAVEEAIKALDDWAHIRQSVWYLQWPHDAQIVRQLDLAVHGLARPVDRHRGEQCLVAQHDC